MFFLFGWGRRTRRVVGSAQRQCPKCTRGQVYDLIHSRTWFTLFFIPVIPYESQYWFICRDCQCGYKLTEPEFQDVKARMAFGGEGLSEKLPEVGAPE